MTSMTTTTGPVTGGVDTHGETNHAAVIDQIGRQLGDKEFLTTPTGYRALLTWLRGHGHLQRVGIEELAWPGICMPRKCRSSRSTARIARPAAHMASPTRWTPTPQHAPSCLVPPTAPRRAAMGG